MGDEDNVRRDSGDFTGGVRVKRIRDNRQANRRSDSKATMSQPFDGYLARSYVSRLVMFVSCPAANQEQN